MKLQSPDISMGLSQNALHLILAPCKLPKVPNMNLYIFNINTLFKKQIKNIYLICIKLNLPKKYHLP